jgi:hypothetical protein
MGQQQEVTKLTSYDLDFSSQHNFLPKLMKPIVGNQSSLQTTEAGNRIVTHCLANYKAVIHHLSIDTSPQNIILALHDLGFDVISVQLIKTKLP